MKDAFGHLGTVILVSGRRISAAKLRDADLLLVRSVTQVNAELLAGTSVKMVCSATIGTDHIDLAYLAQRGITFANAAGSNAKSVAEYVIAALLELAVEKHWSLSQVSLGIIGVGNIGKLVWKMAEGLGMRVLLNDPPLSRQLGDPIYVLLDELMQADILTLHVPLTYAGEDKTIHLFDEERLKKMRRGSVLINTSRGAIVDDQALKKKLIQGHLSSAILDVWEDEPAIDLELLKLTMIATPHIAGYSLDGKANGTALIYQAVCRRFEITSQWQVGQSLPEPGIKSIRIEDPKRNDEKLLAKIVQNIYDIRRDDQDFRRIVQLPQEQTADFFDRLRRAYPVRREFHLTRVILPCEQPELHHKLTTLGFQVQIGA